MTGSTIDWCPENVHTCDMAVSHFGGHSADGHERGGQGVRPHEVYETQGVAATHTNAE